jgi:hypothetical protein
MKKDLETNELDRNMVYDRTLWRHLIHVAIPIPLGGIRLGGGGGCCIVHTKNTLKKKKLYILHTNHMKIGLRGNRQKQNGRKSQKRSCVLALAPNLVFECGFS